MRSPSSSLSQEKKEVTSSFVHLFVLFKLSMDWMVSTHTGDGDTLVNLPIQMLIPTKRLHRQTQK